MEKLKKYFQAIGFSGEALDKVLDAFVVKYALAGVVDRGGI